MKKLLLGTIVLLIFCSALMVFQMSCTKSSEASPSPQENKVDTLVIIKRDTVWMKEPVGIQQQNKVVYITYDKNDISTIWLSNYDGSEKQEVTISSADGLDEIDALKVSPDGKTVIFCGFNHSDPNYITYLYTGTLDGNGIKDLKLLETHNGGLEAKDMY